MDEFSASYDRTTKIVSAIACMLLAIPAATVHSIGVRIVSVLVMLVSYAYSPRSYGFADGSIVIKRLVGTVRIPFKDIQDVRPVTKEDLTGTIRLWGSGGMFGYYGWFQTPRLGRCKWYMTDRSKAVVVRTATQTVLVSPDPREIFLDRIRAWAPPRAKSADQPLAGTLASVGSPAWVGPVAVGVVMAVAGAVTSLVLLYAPGPPGYSLTADAITIHDRFYPVTVPAPGVDVRNIRVVDLTRDLEWRPTTRTN